MMFVCLTQKSHSEYGSAMDLWRSFHAAVLDTFFVVSIHTRFLVVVEMSLPGDLLLVHVLLFPYAAHAVWGSFLDI